MCNMLGGHQWPMHNEKLLQVTQIQSCKNDKQNPMLHSETQRTTKFCVKAIESPMEDSMQENGVERKMFTLESIGIN